MVIIYDLHITKYKTIPVINKLRYILLDILVKDPVRIENVTGRSNTG